MHSVLIRFPCRKLKILIELWLYILSVSVLKFCEYLSSETQKNMMVSEYFQYRLPLESTIRFLNKKPEAYPEPSRTSKVEMFYLFSQKAPS